MTRLSANDCGVRDLLFCVLNHSAFTALTEMFPKSVRDKTSSVTSKTYSAGASALWFSQQVAWYGATTFMFLMFPYVIAREQCNMIVSFEFILAAIQNSMLQEQSKAQQQQMLLGPSAAMAGK